MGNPPAQLQPGDVIVIDNASFHRSQAIDQIVAEAGCGTSKDSSLFRSAKRSHRSYSAQAAEPVVASNQARRCAVSSVGSAPLRDFAR